MELVTYTDLNYAQRLQLGVIRARKQFGEEARAKAMRAAQDGNEAASFVLHQEADQHEEAIIQACMTIASEQLTKNKTKSARPKG
jgi:hypothetical protein